MRADKIGDNYIGPAGHEWIAGGSLALAIAYRGRWSLASANIAAEVQQLELSS
jgi:hypothetical protein